LFLHKYRKCVKALRGKLQFYRTVLVFLRSNVGLNGFRSVVVCLPQYLFYFDIFILPKNNNKT